MIEITITTTKKAITATKNPITFPQLLTATPTANPFYVTILNIVMKNTIDVNLPMYDDVQGSLTPHVSAALAGGATVRPHETDSLKIVLSFEDEAQAQAFEAAITPEPKAQKKK